MEDEEEYFSGGEPGEVMTQEELEEALLYDEVATFVQDKFTTAADSRRDTEDKWLAAYRDWRGVYSPEEQANMALMEAKNPGISKAFVKISKTKTMAAYSQALDVLFAGNKFPIGIEPTPVPDGVDEEIYIDKNNVGSAPTEGPAEDVIGFDGDGKKLEPGATEQSLLKNLGSTVKGLFGGANAVAGNSPHPELPDFHPAQESAKKLEKVIHDQLLESKGEFALRRSVFECCLLGTGVVKGPMTDVKTVHKYKQTEDGIEYVPEDKLAPIVEPVSVWNFYPDPDAIRLEDAEFVIERHLLNRQQLRALKKRPGFKSEEIDEALQNNPKYAPEHWEQDIRDNNQDTERNRYEVLEYWGYIDEDMADKLNLSFDTNQDYQVNIWTVNGSVIRVVTNEYVPQILPYYAFPFEEHPNQLWGVGVPENMRDTQQLMNGHWRLAIDNLRLAGNVVFEVNENQLVPGQDLTVYPGKIFRKQGGAPGQSIFGIKFPDTSQSHMAAFDKARQLADEQTGIPSFSHGSTNVSGTGRTAAGMSMLMGAAALTTKTFIKNVDHYLLRPLGNGYFRWNMQFNEDNIEIRGDYEISAKGTSSLLQREVKSQRLLTFLQVGASNQLTAPMLDVKYILEELAKSLDLDPERVINDPDTAKMYAELLQAQGGLNANQQGTGAGPGGSSPGAGQGGVEQAPPGANSNDNTGAGGGNIGVGGVPQQGEAGFSG